MKSKYWILLLCLISSANLYGQAYINLKTVTKADESFKQYAYAEALDLYLFAYRKDTVSEHLTSQIANCYLKLNNSILAEEWLQKRIALEAQPTGISYFLLAEVMAKNGKYEEAVKWYERYLTCMDDSVAIIKLNGIRDLGTYSEDSKKFSIEKMEFNSPEMDFGPMFYQGGIAFVSSRMEQKWVAKEYSWDGADYLDFYYFNPKDSSREIRKIKELNSKYHEGPGQFFDQGNRVIFTRTNLVANKFNSVRKLNKDAQGVTNLTLFVSEKEASGVWKEPKVLLPSTKEYSYGHPTLFGSADRLIISSNIEGSIGQSDLYEIRKINDSTWSVPRNLGGLINTEGDEMFPFYLDKKLYFASNGKGGLGGLDIYVSELLKDSSFSKPTNVGAPINSSQDDFGLISSPKFRFGYFSSNRDGNDDIYKFQSEVTTLEGVVYLDSMRLALEEVTVIVKNRDTTFTRLVSTDIEGKFYIDVPSPDSFLITAKKEALRHRNPVSVATNGKQNEIVIDTLWMEQSLLELNIFDSKTQEPIQNALTVLSVLNKNISIIALNDSLKQYRLNPGWQYELITTKDGYYKHRDTIHTNAEYWGYRAEDIPLKPIVVGESIRLDNIYYDLGSATLRQESEGELDKVVRFMEDNPHIKIELSSHTDARGSSTSNMKLSQRRAESVGDYLIKHGIPTDRIVPKGYGESKLSNRCADGVRCSQEEHQENRRTEIQILENH